MKIGIIGVGNVGVSIAYTMFFKKGITEIRLNDINKDKALGEAEDLRQAAGIMRSSIIINAVRKKYLIHCDYIFICCGKARQSSSEEMNGLYKDNARLLKKVIKDLPRDKIYIITNPVERLAKLFKVKYLGKILDETRYLMKAKDGGWIVDKKGNTRWGVAMEAWRVVK
ncbi:hypothetical protein LCGC14_1809470 [marine sediment metagenome]|uniref:Lactate/malate dehydrogenase N-terminal domain-containing protein n=1 Tax=marine sediment metagenome TaxID=412755 RepID=A0A0F9GM21_9ZZZZ